MFDKIQVELQQLWAVLWNLLAIKTLFTLDFQHRLNTSKAIMR